MDRVVYETMGKVEGEHWWFVARRRLIARLLEDMALEDPAILEAGCGTGGNLDLLRRFGRVSAFELDPVARAKAGVPAGSLPDHIPFDGPFDLACLFDVLEHIEEDVPALAALAEISEQLVLTVPALPSLWSEHDERHHHHRRYTKDSLARVLGEGGWQVERIGYFNSFLLPAAIAQRAISRRYEADKTPPAPLNALLTRIFAFERHFLGKLPIGLSLFAVARRA